MTREATLHTNPVRAMQRRPRWFELGVAFVVLGSLAQWATAFVGDNDWAIHGLWCTVGLCLALPTFVATLRSGSEFVLTDHRLMFVGAFVLYFLLGALLPAIGPGDEIQASLAFYPIGARDALRVDAVNGIGVGIALIASVLSRGQYLGRLARRAASVTARINLALALWILLLLGAAASFPVLVVDLGLREGTVSGWLRSGAQLPLVAILLASAAKGRGATFLRTGAIALAVLQCAIGLLLFNKSAALLPLAAVMGGLTWRFGLRRILPVALVVLITAFMAIGGPTTYARRALALNSGTILHAGTILEARWAMLIDGWSAWWNGGAEAEYGEWSRFCYLPPQAAALDLYDNGDGGNDLALVPWLAVPRLLAPNKPIISRSANDFNLKITGSDSSAAGVGVFVHGYYNGGWLGMALAALACGWIVAQTSAIAVAVVAERGLLLLPLGLAGVYMAFRIDGNLVTDYLGFFVVLLVLLLAASLLTRVKA